MNGTNNTTGKKSGRVCAPPAGTILRFCLPAGCLIIVNYAWFNKTKLFGVSVIQLGEYIAVIERDCRKEPSWGIFSFFQLEYIEARTCRFHREQGKRQRRNERG